VKIDVEHARFLLKLWVFAWKSVARRRLTLPTVVARGKAGFSAEELCEMAGVCVANIKGNIHNALLRFAKQSSRDIHAQINLIARRRNARGTLEQALKVKLAQPRLSR
jgi:hypothetical protein